ncbi:MAG: enoyl-CoA hydratase/isomerase family protein [Acetobacteraceae bacterium]|nr:enoyl-CoA hydratase/isomerase family protein [Acetobacteraceae bacterium]
MQVETTISGAVATVTLNRPEKMNALTREMREALIAAFQSLRFNDDVRAVVLAGSGADFCAGADIDRMAEDDLRARRDRLQGLSQTYMRILHALEKPVIAAVRGHAVGIGLSLVLGCDIVLASDTARLGATFRRIGYAPDGGGIWFLARRLPMNIAKELVFTGRVFDAAEGQRLGLVNHVIPDGELDARAAAMAAEMAQGPTFALGLSKKLFHVAAGPSLEDFLEYEAFVQPTLGASRDHKEGVAAFREKRRPKFTGR